MITEHYRITYLGASAISGDLCELIIKHSRETTYNAAQGLPLVLAPVARAP
jgi:hypothetical protein